MDKVLAFSILSASPADIAAGAAAFPTTRLSWRRGAGASGQQGDSAEAAAQRQRDGENQGGGSSPCPHGHGGGGGKDQATPPAAFLPRFAPEFDGIDCFETIVSH